MKKASKKRKKEEGMNEKEEKTKKSTEDEHSYQHEDVINDKRGRGVSQRQNSYEKLLC